MLLLKDIVKNYQTGTETVNALKGVSISFRKSEFVSILGQSGCGKTTLMRIIAEMEDLDKGEIELDSETEQFFEATKVKLKLNDNVELEPLQGDNVDYKQFDTYGTGELSKENSNEKSYYLTLNKTLSSNEEFKYTNYVEITEYAMKNRKKKKANRKQK